MEYNPELLQKIISVIDTSIRPSLNMDGGDISVISLEGNILNVRLQGACSGCPRAAETLQYGIERTLRSMVSEEIEVRAV